jgi:hypothetical protein
VDPELLAELAAGLADRALIVVDVHQDLAQ